MAEPIIVGGAFAENRNRRVLVLGGVAAALILGMVVLPGLLFGGGGGADDTTTLPPVVGANPTTVPGNPPAETFEVFSDKNPFAPLYVAGPSGGEPAPPPVEPVSPPPPAVDEGTFDGGIVVIGDTPTTSDGGTTSPGEPAPQPAPGPPARQPDRVSLLEVFIDPSGRAIASVRVNDTVHQAAEGDEFAGSYRLLDVDSSTRCVQLLFGDDRFQLCEGEETLK